MPGYTGNGVKQATFKEGLVSLPDPGAKMADGSALLTGSDLEAWRDWRRVLLRSPNELHEVIAPKGELLLILTRNSNGNLSVIARLLRDMSLCGLATFGAPSEATVGVFYGPEEN